MEDREILSNAIDKAVTSGYDHLTYVAHRGLGKINESYFEGNLHFPIIFSHSFAKAFWGKEQTAWKIINSGVQPRFDKDDTMPAWKVHLQQMVLEENPIKYLEKFL